jgi:hypothetical protein
MMGCDAADPASPILVADAPVALSTAGTPYATGLLRWYHFDDASTFLKDFGPNGVTASCSGSSCPALTSNGRYGGAADFDGVDDILTSGSITPPATGTVAFWFVADRNNRRQRFFGGHDAFEVTIEANAAVANNLYAGGSDYVQGGSIPTGSWRHVVFTYDRASRRQEIYVNGQLVASGDKADDTPSSMTLAIGNRSGARDFFDGRIDELAMWNRVLSSAEVSAVYQQTATDGGSGGGSGGGSTTDTTAPSVSLTAPADGAYLSGTVALKASASDNVGVKRVRFNVNGSQVGVDSIPPYEVTWNSGSVPEGNYKLTAVATDAAGNSTTSAVVNVSTGVSGGGGGGGTTNPLPSGTWNRVVRDTLVNGNLVIPAGQTWLIGPNVRVAGNVLVQNAVMAMRPGSSLEIVGADPTKYVGGGLHYTSTLNNDRGVWVWGSGQLDIACTPKTGWNRTGVDPSWLPGDEYWVTATGTSERAPRRWTFGQSVPRANSKVPPAEIMNVTRDCVIKGPGHIHVNSSRPQRVEYVRLQGLGISNAASTGPVLGRYALHFHLSGDGTRGSSIRGVAAVGSLGTVFVPHSSHGVTMIDNVSVNSFAEGLWWDIQHETHDLLVDRLVVAGVFMPRDVSGVTSRHSAATLGAGAGMEIRNSVATGACCNKLSNGFDWPGNAPGDGGAHPVIWKFDQGNVAHNNTGPGIRFWTNARDAHVVNDYIGYRNRSVAGIELGAYSNGVVHRNIVLVEETILHHASPKLNKEDQTSAWIRCEVHAPSGQPAFISGDRKLDAETFTEVVDCQLNGTPKVYVRTGRHPARLKFVRSGVTPNDVVFESGSGNEDSLVIIQNADGSGWQIRIVNGQRSVKPL